MLVMGISGGPFRTAEDGARYISRFQFHDASAVLLKDGEIVAACEGERLNRIKHSNKFPSEAIRLCLESSAVRLEDIDRLAYYAEEALIDSAVKQWNLQRALEEQDYREYPNARHMLQGLLADEFGYAFPLDRISFVNHHYAHALSAILPSGFDQALIVTLDAQGDNESGRIMVGGPRSVDLLKTFGTAQTLGGLYAFLIRLLGFQQFDEYKAMGLAPNGDPSRLRSQFERFFTLLPDGDYSLNWQEIARFQENTVPRKQHQDFSHDQMDVAAALQETLETIVLHVLSYYRRKTNQRNLCFAGGVAHNCSLNGKILQSGLFDAVFVQPAAHDAGCAYGAALAVHFDQTRTGVSSLSHLYWGTDVGSQKEIDEAITPWKDFVSVQHVDDICDAAAHLVAGGAVIGWVQGRSEFGPRALGNRSILADPRPASNKDRINAMVKKREAFRPFAPSVLREHASEFFELEGPLADFDHMIFVVRVRPEWRLRLGAVTHVDGTARIQTVSRETNPRFWQLIESFGHITGVPVMLNTSFNNNAEPIVDSATHAMVCFLTTQLDYLVIGDVLITKIEASTMQWNELFPSLPQHLILSQTRRTGPAGESVVLFEIRSNYDGVFKRDISPRLFDVLLRADGKKTLLELLDGESNSVMLGEIRDLWSRRLIALSPRHVHGLSVIGAANTAASLRI